MNELTLREEITARRLATDHGIPLGVVRHDMMMLRALPSWKLREIAGVPPTFLDRMLRTFHLLLHP